MLQLLIGVVMASTPNWDFAARHPTAPVVIAHRGASAEAPENTLAAYRRALELGAAAVETDTFVTADGQLVLMHDPDLDRTTDGTGPIAEHTLAEIRTLDAGSWFGPEFAGEPVPTLQELLELVGTRAVLCLEIKSGDQAARRVAEAVTAAGLQGQVIVFSFDSEAVAEARQYLPGAPALLLEHDDTTGLLERARAVDAQLVGVNHKVLSGAFVAEAHEKGLSVFTYTVDEDEDLHRVRAMGVDGVISNRADVHNR